MLTWNKPLRGGRTSGTRKFKFRLSNHKGGGERNKQAVIFIHETAMKELRWVVGDKVIYAVDDRCVYLKRVPKDGFSLSAAVGGKREDSLGKMVSSAIKSSTYKFDFDAPVYIADYIVKDDVVMISYRDV